jgi:hypothetical protein
VAAATTLVLSLPSLASAIPLSELILDPSASFSADGSPITFSAFEAFGTGSVGDLSLYEITFEHNGWTLIGPLAAADGEAADLAISFSVWSEVPLVAAELAFTGTAGGFGASATVSETLAGAPGFVLGVGVTGGGGAHTIDRALLPGEGTGMHFAFYKNLVVDSDHEGGFAQISRVSQRYEIVPEPSSALLLLVGALGVAGLRRGTSR